MIKVVEEVNERLICEIPDTDLCVDSLIYNGKKYNVWLNVNRVPTFKDLRESYKYMVLELPKDENRIVVDQVVICKVNPKMTVEEFISKHTHDLYFEEVITVPSIDGDIYVIGWWD